MKQARPWALWVLGTLGTLPVSYLVWWLWGMGLCGEEVYDTPSGSTADALCRGLVEPVWPWVLVAASPTLLALVGGFLGLRLRNPRVLGFSLLAPLALGLLTFILAPALL